MSTAELNPKPLRVSPFIRFNRWALLSVGVLYGAFHYNRLSKRENARREEELRQKPARDAQLAEEKKRMRAAEEQMLADLMKSTPK